MGDQVNSDEGYIALSYILAGPLCYGVLGWLADRWLHTSFLLPVGLLVGIVLGLYMVVKKFGGLPHAGAARSAEDNTSGEESR